MAFLALIYGMYLKISASRDVISSTIDNFYYNLSKNEKIKNIEVIDEDNLLILIDKGDDLRGAIYNINKNKIIRFIDREND